MSGISDNFPRTRSPPSRSDGYVCSIARSKSACFFCCRLTFSGSARPRPSVCFMRRSAASACSCLLVSCKVQNFYNPFRSAHNSSQIRMGSVRKKGRMNTVAQRKRKFLLGQADGRELLFPLCRTMPLVPRYPHNKKYRAPSFEWKNQYVRKGNGSTTQFTWLKCFENIFVERNQLWKKRKHIKLDRFACTMLQKPKTLSPSVTPPSEPYFMGVEGWMGRLQRVLLKWAIGFPLSLGVDARFRLFVIIKFILVVLNCLSHRTIFFSCFFCLLICTGPLLEFQGLFIFVYAIIGPSHFPKSYVDILLPWCYFDSAGRPERWDAVAPSKFISPFFPSSDPREIPWNFADKSHCRA